MTTKISLVSDLNEPQLEAAFYVGGPLLVLAGAGSGKTRVVTHRIAHLILEKGLPPGRILAVTFTNKAAREMTQRVQALAGDRANGLWIGTFHSMCARILRRHADLLDYPREFTIFDSDDQRNLIKKIVQELNWDPQKWRPAQVQTKISRAKNHLISPEKLASENRRRDDPLLAQIYAEFQEQLKKSGAMDFDDLLLLTVELFSDFELVRSQYQNQFEHVIVDEYQDTNQPQDVLTRVLAAPQNNLCVVGDDDQSIYRWRGARFKNILNLPEVYPGLKIVRLEQNYRSTSNVLQAAHSVISFNIDRHEKTLWTDRPKGEPVLLLVADTEEDEALQVVKRIESFEQSGVSRDEIAVLYRTNAQSRILEEILLREKVPYRIVGGLAFYQRREIKTLLSYLQALIRPEDDVSFLRIVNTPRRGIGQTTLRQIQAVAGREGKSLFHIAERASQHPEISSSGALKLENLCRLLSKWAGKIEDRPLADTLMDIIKETDFEEYLKKEDAAKAEARIENARELLSAIQAAETSASFETVQPWRSASEAKEPTRREKLEVFLERVALESDRETADESVPAVSLMTLHSAKGLEFSRVFITGMEDGVFPHENSLGSKEELEEERRLCYVGMTRAKDQLALSYARSRRIWNSTMPRTPSRFLREIPEDLLERPDNDLFGENSLQLRVSNPRQKSGFSLRNQVAGAGGRDAEVKARPSAAAPKYPDFLAPGKPVRHRTFGLGRVVEVEGAEPSLRVTVRFQIVGVKTLVQRFARLEPA